MLRYRFLKTNKLNPNAAVEDNCNIWRDVVNGEKIVIHSCADMSYDVFNNHEELKDFIEALPASERNFHEVIYGARRQKIKFDLDMGRDLLDEYIMSLCSLNARWDGGPNFDATLEYVMNVLPDFPAEPTFHDIAAVRILAIVLELIVRIANGRCPPEEEGETIELGDFAIFTSSDYKTKWSFHIVCTSYYMPDCFYAQAFTNYLLNVIDSTRTRHILASIDKNVNKVVQNFRILGCCKASSPNRVKKCSPRFTFEDSLITYTDDCLGPHYCDALRIQAEELRAKTPGAGNGGEMPDDPEILAIIEECAPNCEDYEQVLNGDLEFEPMGRDGDRIFINFSNAGGRHNCSLCSRHHTGDPRTMAWVVNADGSVHWICRRTPGLSRELRGPTGTGAPIQIQAPVVSFAEKMQKKLSNFARPDAQVDPKMLPKSPIKLTYVDAELLADFVFEHTLVVKAQMGTGKTQATIRYIKAQLAKNPNFRVLFVSSRKSLTAEFKRVFESIGPIGIYTEKDFRTKQHMIVQYESLRKVRGLVGIGSVFGLVVLDELEQTYSCSDNVSGQKSANSFHTNFGALESALKYIPKCIVLDATIGPRSISLMLRKRPGYEVIINTHASKRGINFDYYESEPDLERSILRGVAEGKKIVITTTSKKWGTKIENTIKKAYEKAHGREIALLHINGDNSSKAEIKEILSNVNAHVGNYSVFIYTQTITAGVSITIEHFDELYQYCSTRSADVQTAIQMIGRVRNIRKYSAYVKPSAYSGVKALTREKAFELYCAISKNIRAGKLEHIAEARRIKKLIKEGHEVSDVDKTMAERWKFAYDIESIIELEDLLESAGPFRDTTKEEWAPMTTPYLEFRMPQWIHASFCNSNFDAYYLSFIREMGFIINYIPKSGIKDNAEEKEIKAAARESEKAAALLENADIAALLTAPPVVVGEVEVDALSVAIMNAEAEEKRVVDQEAKQTLQGNIRKMKRVRFVGCKNPANIQNALDSYNQIFMLEKLRERTGVKDFESLVLSKSEFDKDRVLDSVTWRFAEWEEYDRGAKDVYNVGEVEGAKKARLAILGLKLLEVLGYIVNGPLRPELINAASPYKNRASFVEKSREIADFMKANADELEWANRQKSANRKTYKTISEGVNSVLAGLGWRIMLVNPKDKNSNVILAPVKCAKYDTAAGRYVLSE